MKKKRLGFLGWVLLSAGALFVGLTAFAVARYLLAAGSENGFDIFAWLWEVLPAFVVWLILFVLTLIFYRVCVTGLIKQVACEVESAVDRHDEGVAASELRSEWSDIGRAVEHLDEALKERIASERKLAADRVRRETFLSAALSVEEELSPVKSSYREDHYGIAAAVRRTERAEGDFYDWFFRDGRSVCFVVGDVWGSGFSAVLFAAKIKELFRMSVHNCDTLCEAVNAVNAALCADNGESLALTAFFGMFTPSTGELRYVNAGHYPPMLIGEESRYLRMKTGSPLGLYEDCNVMEEYIVLPSGSAVLLYTNGIPFARNAEGEGFGYDRLFEAAQKGRNRALGAEEVVSAAEEAMNEFCGQEGQEDDGVLLALYFPKGLQKKFASKTSELERLRDVLLEWLKDDARKNKIFLACEEVFTNIVNHSKASSIQLDCRIEGESLFVCFVDDGEPFNPLQVQSGYRDYTGGGMGMAIIRQIAGEVHYRMQENRNVLTMRFPVLKGN